MFEVDWAELFVPSGSLLEIAIRGSVVYWALFCALRFLPRREVGGMGPSDILVIVIIADAVQNGMAGEYRSVTEALVIAAVIFGWATLIDWIDDRFPDLHLAKARKVQLVRNGKMLPSAMKRNHISEEELMEQLRLEGVEAVEDVGDAYVEGDGQVSVIPRDKKKRLAGS